MIGERELMSKTDPGANLGERDGRVQGRSMAQTHDVIWAIDINNIEVSDHGQRKTIGKENKKRTACCQIEV